MIQFKHNKAFLRQPCKALTPLEDFFCFFQILLANFFAPIKPFQSARAGYAQVMKLIKPSLFPSQCLFTSAVKANELLVAYKKMNS